jgi:hypothetical protein
MYIKVKDGWVKQIIFCCEKMSLSVQDGSVEYIGKELYYNDEPFKYCLHCGAKVDISELY